MGKDRWGHPVILFMGVNARGDTPQPTHPSSCSYESHRSHVVMMVTKNSSVCRVLPQARHKRGDLEANIRLFAYFMEQAIAAMSK
eukprot:953862-Amphidinium_carterae.1